MTTMKTLGAALVLSAMIAAPACAKDTGNRHGVTSKHGSMSRHVRAHHRSYVRGAFIPRQPSDRYDPDPEFQRNIDNFGFSGRDPSRIGGEDPSLHPSQY